MKEELLNVDGYNSNTMMVKEHWLNKGLVFISLFSSFSTLLCCGVPILLILLGFGASLASFTNAFPWLNNLGNYEGWLLLVTAILLFITYLIQQRNNYCPANPEQAAACQKAKRFNKIIFWISVALWVVGFVSSYVLYAVRILFDF